MSSTFNTLRIGYSALRAAQVAVDTTSHNIANAESEGYTRQRVVTAAATPIYSSPGNIGNGAQITDIARVFDSFVFERFTDISADKEYSDFLKSTLGELSTYFPEIDDVGIKSDLQEYYNMWQTYADNPDSDAIKLALAKQAEIVSDSIKNTQDRILSLQKSVNDQVLPNVQEVNLLAEKLASINAQIGVAESGDAYTANDLRDKRSVIEEKLAKLIGANVLNGQIESNAGIDSHLNEETGSYTMSINGFNIVDGASFHPIHVSAEGNSNGFYELSYERQDGSLIPMSGSIIGGRIGAMLDLRGKEVISSNYGVPTDGVLQKVVNQMDAFASKLIESTNNLYADSASTQMESNKFSIDGNDPILSSVLDSINKGSFDIVIYDIDGKEVARRNISIDESTTMSGAAGSNSIEGQIKAQIDDNGDSNANNDIDNLMGFKFTTYLDGTSSLGLSMDALYAGKGYKFAIEDKLQNNSFSSGTNFAGALGLNRFFDGNNAQTMQLNSRFKENPTLISSGFTPVAGDNRLALNIVQQQFENYDFELNNITSYNATMYGMFDIIATEVGVSSNEAILANDTITAKYNATELEFSSISKVSIDEELTNLIKYQTSYGAASKVITTIDQMMQTLLGIKQ